MIVSCVRKEGKILLSHHFHSGQAKPSHLWLRGRGGFFYLYLTQWSLLARGRMSDCQEYWRVSRHWSQTLLNFAKCWNYDFLQDSLTNGTWLNLNRNKLRNLNCYTLKSGNWFIATLSDCGFKFWLIFKKIDAHLTPDRDQVWHNSWFSNDELFASQLNFWHE